MYSCLSGNQVQIKNKGRENSREEIFCGIKFCFYVADSYEVVKGTKIVN